jgi:hypothetical protein
MSSAQSLVRIGGPVDVYYQDSENAKKQVIPTLADQRYTQAFSNLAQGTSVFTIPPNGGISHVVAVMGYSASALSTVPSTFALNRSWGYEAIDQVSFRIGGSSQYFLTGAQLLARNLRNARTQSQRDSMLQLGGSVFVGTGAAQTAPQYAYVPISVWAMPGDDGLNLPLPSDLLSQQIQITITLKPSYVSAGAGNGTVSTVPNQGFWHLATGSTLAGLVLPPASLSTAYFQVQQIQMKDRGMALNNRVDMDTEMYSMALPGGFDQYEQTFQLSSAVDGSAPQQVVLTGFRAGEVKEIQFWLSKNVVSTDATTYDAAANSELWYPPSSLQVLYAGLVYSNFNNGSSQIWNLLNGTSPSAVNQNVLTSAGGVWSLSSNPQLSQWTTCEFAQPTGSDYEADMLVHGLEITNGIVNVQVTPPPSATAGVANAWTLHVTYVYGCTLGFSRGTADLIF